LSRSKRILVLSPEPVRPRMAGMGIRAFELARALAPEFEVTLLASNDPSECPPSSGARVLHAPPGSAAFREAAAVADAALVSGHAASDFLLAAPELPVAVDWYDPFLVENFRYLEALGPGIEASDRRAWSLALSRGDFFLCASEAQRLFYAGMLLQAGRIDARRLHEDPELASLLAIVPFGASDPVAGDPRWVRDALRAGPEDPVLYFGGLYDWHDPSPVFEAWPGILRRFPGSRLVFSENPNRETTPQLVFEGAVAESARRGWKDRSVFFLPWVPYEKRWDLYAASTLSVCCCRPGLETELSFRTRLLDAAAAGLPSVSIGGGGLARRIEEAGAGTSVETSADLERRALELLADPEARAQASRRARRLAEEFTWRRVSAPLAAFLRRAEISRRLPLPEEAPRPAFRLFGKGRR
jgi:glycosyltransferase involved in cell wall biosynthesis